MYLGFNRRVELGSVSSYTKLRGSSGEPVYSLDFERSLVWFTCKLSGVSQWAWIPWSRMSEVFQWQRAYSNIWRNPTPPVSNSAAMFFRTIPSRVIGRLLFSRLQKKKKNDVQLYFNMKKPESGAPFDISVHMMFMYIACCLLIICMCRLLGEHSLPGSLYLPGRFFDRDQWTSLL